MLRTSYLLHLLPVILHLCLLTVIYEWWFVKDFELILSYYGCSLAPGVEDDVFAIDETFLVLFLTRIL
jgi:hypothetical protein